MRIAALLAAWLAVGCYEDRYQCTTDEQCDLHENGRCEASGYCTKHDPTCPTERRFTEHSGEATGDCYDDRVSPANRCAGGQGAAQPDGCLADVCERLPACCEIAWTEACVQLAQQSCDLRCDTRIALTANRGATTELWDLRWNGTAWTVKREPIIDDGYSWVAPERGSVEPRLSGEDGDALLIGTQTLPGRALGRDYQAITSIGFDRNGTQVIAAGYTGGEGNAVELFDLVTAPDATPRDVDVSATQNLTWGDINRDAFPDAVARTGGTYTFLENFADDVNFRKLSAQVSSAVTGGQTPGAPNLRSLDWLDFDGDRRLDLVAFGMSVRIHTNFDGIRDAAEYELDCLPPSATKSCSSDPEPNLESASFAGAAHPDLDEPSVIVATFPARKLHRVRVQGGPAIVSPLAFPGDGCTCDGTCSNMCPGPNCTCTYDCSMCVPILAVVSRDLDGDRRLDLVAIDARLRVYTAMAATNLTWSAPTQIPTTFANTFVSVTTSVTGAPIP